MDKKNRLWIFILIYGLLILLSGILIFKSFDETDLPTLTIWGVFLIIEFLLIGNLKSNRKKSSNFIGLFLILGFLLIVIRELFVEFENNYLTWDFWIPLLISIALSFPLISFFAKRLEFHRWKEPIILFIKENWFRLSILLILVAGLIIYAGSAQVGRFQKFNKENILDTKTGVIYHDSGMGKTPYPWNKPIE